MKKSAKTTISIITVVLVTIVAAVILVVFSLRNAPAKYLCEKYDFDRSQLKCVEYIPKHYFFDLNCWESGWTTSTWIFSYDGKEFIVKNIDDEYYDDYQFDEYCNWCIDYLNSYLSENVASVLLNSKCFFENNEKLTKNEYKSMLYAEGGILIYLSFEDIKQYIDNDDNAKQISINVDKEIKELGFSKETFVVIVDKSVEFKNEITNYSGDRVLLTYHNIAENPQDLRDLDKIKYTY